MAGPGGGRAHRDRDGAVPHDEHRRGAGPQRRPRRRRGLRLRPVLPRRRPADLRLLRPARPQGHLHAHRRRPRRLGRARQHPGRRVGAGAPRVRADRADAAVPLLGRRRALARPDGPARRPRARGLVPGLAGAALRGRRDPARDGAVPGLPAAALRPADALRHVLRPGVRPRLQRRGDGERRPGHLRRRVLRPAEPFDARGAPAPRPGHRPRAGAHVVRQPGDDAVVGRPLAQRGLRGVHGGAHHRPRHRLRRRVGGLRARPQGVGLPRRLAPDHPPDRRAGARQPRGPAQLRRHLLRQGRLRAAPALRVPRRGHLLRRECAATWTGTRGATPRSPTCSTALEEESGRDLDGWARSWLRESGTTTLRMRDGVLVQDGDRPHRVLVGRYDGPAPAAGRAGAGGAAGPGRADPARRPGAAQRRRPDLRQGAARRAVAGDGAHVPAHPRRPARPRAGLGLAVGQRPRRRAATGRPGGRGPGQRRG